MGEGSELSSPQQRLSEFASVNSFRMEEDLTLVNGVGGRRWEEGSAVEVVMVTMTSDGAPTGIPRRSSTGEKKFCAGWSSTGIMTDSCFEV